MVCVLSCSFVACNDPLKDDTSPFEYTLNSGGESWTLSGIGFCKDSVVEIPAKRADGKPVTEIGNRAFKDCIGIKSVSFPDSILKLVSAHFMDAQIYSM